MVNELEAWAQRAQNVPAALVFATPQAVRASAEVLEAEARLTIAEATGGDSRLSRVRSGKGARINLTVGVKGAGRSAQGVVTPTGPIMLIETKTKPHRQPFVYTLNRRVKKRGTKPIHIPGVGVFARVNHPGTKGKRPVARAFERAHREAGVAGVAVFAQTARRTLGGQ